MASADFRIIRQDSHVNQMQTGSDLHRYLITYATTNQPQFIALDSHDRCILVDDEKSAARFPSVEAAQARLDNSPELQDLKSAD